MSDIGRCVVGVSSDTRPSLEGLKMMGTFFFLKFPKAGCDGSCQALSLETHILMGSKRDQTSNLKEDLLRQHLYLGSKTKKISPTLSFTNVSDITKCAYHLKDVTFSTSQGVLVQFNKQVFNYARL